MKKILTVILGVLMVTACVMGCAQSSQSGEASAAPTKDTSEYYATWTKADWDNASDQQKQMAVIFLIEEAAASEGDDEEVVQAAVDQAEESLTPEQYAEIEDAVNAYYDKAGDKGKLEDSIGDLMGTITKYVAIG